MIKRALLVSTMLAMPLLAHAQSTSLTTILGPTLQYNPATGKMDVLPGTTPGTARDAAAAIAAEQAAQAAATAAAATANNALPAAQKNVAGGVAPLGPDALALPDNAARVTTMAALRAHSAPAADGALIRLLAYYSPVDGGGGTFRWSAASMAVDDGGLTINPTGNAGPGRWLRVLDNLPYVSAPDVWWYVSE